MEWEGSKLREECSPRGEHNYECKELRDPYLFWDKELDEVYLYYVGRG